MGEFHYIGFAALQARAMAAIQVGVTQGAEYLVGEQMAQAGVKTGTLKAGIHVAEIVVAGLTVRARTATGGESNDYAIPHHEGSVPHWIIATEAQALWWPGAEHPVEAVLHPGTEANAFMGDPLVANRPLLREFIRRAAAAAF